MNVHWQYIPDVIKQHDDIYAYMLSDTTLVSTAEIETTTWMPAEGSALSTSQFFDPSLACDLHSRDLLNDDAAAAVAAVSWVSTVCGQRFHNNKQQKQQQQHDRILWYIYIPRSIASK